MDDQRDMYPEVFGHDLQAPHDRADHLPFVVALAVEEKVKMIK